MRSFVFCLLLLVGAFSEAAAQRSRTLPTQEAIAADLRSDNLDTLSRGMLYVDHIPYQNWTPALRSAILYALASEIQRDREAMRLGVHRFKDDGTTAFLAEYAIVMQDPAAIPSLVHVRGWDTAFALAKFGRQALPELIRTAHGEDDVGYYDIDHCLTALRLMVQEWGLEYFTEQERAELKATAALYLTPNTPPIWEDFGDVTRALVLQDAARLAMVLDDPELLGWLEPLATDVKAFQEKIGSRRPGMQHYLRQIFDGDLGYPGPGKSLSLDYLFERFGRKQ